MIFKPLRGAPKRKAERPVRTQRLPRRFPTAVALAALAMLAADRVPNGHTLIALQWLQIHGEALRERWR